MARAIPRLWQEQWLVPSIWVGLSLLLLMPLVVTSSTIFPFIVGKASYTRGLIEILVVLWLLLAVASPRYRLSPSWILTIFAAYVIINLLAALFGSSLQRSFWGDYRRMGGVFDLIHWMALLVVLISMVKTTAHWRRLLNLNLGISLTLALLGLAQHFNLEVVSGIFWYFEARERLDITLGNPTFVGAYMMVNALVATAFLAQSFVARPPPKPVPRRERRSRQAKEGVPYWLTGARTFWALVIVLNLWVMLLSGTRGAIVGFAAAMVFTGVVYALLGSRRRLRATAGVATAALLLLVLGFPFLRETTVYEKLAERNVTLERLRNAGISEQLSVQNRVVTARIGLEAFVNAPILGWGPENFAIAFQRYEKPGDFNTSFLSDQAHNRLIDELTTTGVLGFVVYVLLWGRMGQVLYRRIRAHPEEDLFTVLLGAGLVAYFVQNLFLFDAHATYLQALLLIGWLASTEVRLQAAATERAAPATQDGGGRRRARPSQRQAAGGWWAYGPAGRLVETMSHGPDLRWMGGVSLVVILTASLYFTVYRPFQAAQLFPTQLSGRGELIVWEEFWANAGESFSTFPPLATLPRQVLFDTLITNWETVSQFGVDQLIGRVQVEEMAALEAEPENPRLHISLGQLYQKAAETEPQYLARAGEYADAARKLAPGTVDTGLLVVAQELMKGNYQKALDVIEEYDVGLRIDYSKRFAAFRNRAQEGLNAEKG